MTTFPQRVIEAYERTESPLLGRALEAAKIAPVEPGGPMRLPSGLDPARYAAPFHTHSLAWCLLMELKEVVSHEVDLTQDYDSMEYFIGWIDRKSGGARYAAGNSYPEALLAACLAAEGRE